MDDLVIPGVHIVTCTDHTCDEQYTRMCEDLEQNGVVCVEEGRGDYGFGSFLFKDKFREKVDSNLHTIIHLCPDMIEKLGPVEHLLGDDRYKAKCMYINIPSTPRDLPKVYKDATRLRLFNESDYQNIVQRLTHNVQSRLQNSSSAKQQSSATSNISAQQSSAQQHSTAQQQSSAQQQSPAGEKREQFDRGRSRELSFEDEVDGPERETFCESVGDVFYLNSRLQHSNPDLLKFSGARDLEDICVRTEMYTRENRAKTVLWLQTTVLPEVARSADVAAVIVLLKSPIGQIRERAQQIFLKILFSKEIGDIKEEPLRTAESSLFEQAMKVNVRKDSSNEGSELTCIYLVTIMHRIVSLMAHNKPTVPFFTRRLQGFQAEESKLNDVIAFVEDFKDRRDLYIQAVKSAEVKEFPKKKCWQSQFVVALRTIMEIFHGDEDTRVRALESLVKVLKPKRSGTMKLGKSEVKLHPLVGRLVIMGITIFLKSLEERTGEDLQKETVAAFKVLRHEPDLFSDNFKIARDLVFSKNDLIRKEAILLLTTTNQYHDVVHFMALSDVSEQLQPINVDLTEAQRKSGSPKSNSWMKFPVGRVSERVMLHIHLPEEADHSKQLKSTLTSNCGHRNTMEILLSLNVNPHILPLLAFRLEQIPVFYVTEDYSQPNLHQVLFSKAKNNQFLQPVQLLELLLQALDALDYLQKNGIVHRDISASSFTYSRGSNQVKLYKFHLARRCALEQIIVDRDCSGIPTRWSAPESLSKCHFTFRSDWWMVGHLIYEVITHGTLPYSDLRKSDAEVAELIKRGTKRLAHEGCIPTKVFVAIMDCTKPNENERLSLPEARCKLEETQHDYNSQNHKTTLLTKKDFPDFRRMSFDDPHRGLAGEFANRGVFPRTTSKMCMAEMEADRDEMPLNINTRLLLKIPTVFRVAEMETKLEIKETQKRQLTQEEESFLLTNKLEGFCDHLTVVKYEDGEALSYSIPIDCQGSVRSLVEDGYLGDDSLKYIQCLAECAKALVKLHARKWIHGALSSRNIWIKFTGNRTQVYFSELAYMRESRDDGSGIVSDGAQPPDEDVKRRSAPEVIHGGTYSPACDVFSFGLVVWDVLNCLNSIYTDPNKMEDMTESDLYEYLTTAPGSEIQPRPDECPQEIYSLLKMCWGPERHDRPSMAMVYTKLNEYIRSKSIVYDSCDYEYAEPSIKGEYDVISEICHDGPEYSQTNSSQAFDINDIRPASLATNISTQEADQPCHQAMLRDLGDGSTGKREHIEKFLAEQPTTGTWVERSEQPTTGTHLKLAEQLPRVGSRASNILPFTPQDPQASLTSVATPSDICSDVLSPMRAGEKKIPPPLPPKPPPHARIFRPSDVSLVTPFESDDYEIYEPPSMAQGDDIYDDFQPLMPPQTFPKPQGNNSPSGQYPSGFSRPSLDHVYSNMATLTRQDRSNIPLPSAPNMDLSSSPLATVEGQTLPGLSLVDSRTQFQASLDRPPPVPIRSPPHRSRKDKK